MDDGRVTERADSMTRGTVTITLGMGLLMAAMPPLLFFVLVSGQLSTAVTPLALMPSLVMGVGTAMLLRRTRAFLGALARSLGAGLCATVAQLVVLALTGIVDGRMVPGLARILVSTAPTSLLWPILGLPGVGAALIWGFARGWIGTRRPQGV